MLTEGFLDDVRQFNTDEALEDTCTVYRSSFGSSSRSSASVQSFAAGVSSPFRLDDNENGPFPQYMKDNIDVDKVWRTGYVPWGTQIGIKDEIVHDQTGIRYRIIDITLETEAVDIPLLLEVK